MVSFERVAHVSLAHVSALAHVTTSIASRVVVQLHDLALDRHLHGLHLGDLVLAQPHTPAACASVVLTIPVTVAGAVAGVAAVITTVTITVPVAVEISLQLRRLTDVFTPVTALSEVVTIREVDAVYVVAVVGLVEAAPALAGRGGSAAVCDRGVAANA